MRVPVLQWLPNYSRNYLLSDLVAGITVGVTVIPQALAYATIAGLPPEVLYPDQRAPFTVNCNLLLNVSSMVCTRLISGASCT